MFTETYLLNIFFLRKETIGWPEFIYLTLLLQSGRISYSFWSSFKNVKQWNQCNFELSFQKETDKFACYVWLSAKAADVFR